MARIVAAMIVISLALQGCANYRPVIDTKNVDMGKYERDLGECQAYAQSMSPGMSAAAGAAIGAVLGAVLAAAAGSRYDRDASARVGAVGGAVAGGAQGADGQMDIIRNCLRGRGYSVLN